MGTYHRGKRWTHDFRLLGTYSIHEVQRRGQAQEIQPLACVCCSWLWDPLILQPTWAVRLLPATARSHYPYYVGSETKLSVCLRATDTHITKQFQENLRPSRVKVIVLSVLWDLGVQYSLWACQHIFCTQFLLGTQGGSGLLLDPPCIAGILDLWPCHSSLFFLIAVSLLVCTTSPSVTNSLWVLGQNFSSSHTLSVVCQGAVMIDHTHTQQTMVSPPFG